MSLHGSTPIAASGPTAWFKRWYQGPDVTITVDGLPPLRTTPNHPVLTYSGWQPARLVSGWVVAHDDVGDRSIGDLHDHAERHLDWGCGVTVYGRDFRGDGDRFAAQYAGAGGVLRRPLVGEEGEPPAVDPRTVWGVLGDLTGPQAFGCSTWDGARAIVPGLDRVWPAGEPSRRGRGVPAPVARLLGGAVEELPAPRVDHDAVSRSLVGFPGRLRLAPVTSVVADRMGAYVHDVIDPAGCYVAAGIVVG